MIKKTFLRGWNSPTIMTWMSYSTRALSLFIVLPLILKNFTAAEVTLWYLFSSIIMLLSLADLGFKSTFSRIISFAVGGAEDVGIQKGKDPTIREISINWVLIEKICSNMNLIYIYLTAFLLLLLTTIGTWSLIRPISAVSNQHEAWIAWGVVIISALIKFYGTVYQNYLEGLNKIAVIRRIESIMSLGSIISSIVVLLLGGSLLELVLTFQIWSVLNTIRNWFLARIVEEKRYRFFKKQTFDIVLFRKIWKPAWRSGLSGFMSNGLTQLSGILYAQVGSPEIVAGYLLALRIVSQIKEISMAPFYSKIPMMARLRVEGNLKKLTQISQSGMFLGHIVFAVGVLGVAIFSESLLHVLDSNVSFVSNDFWGVLSIAFFVHRYGAMHMQLYLTTNHVISHIADGISGMLFIISSFILIKYIGLYAIPVGMLIGYLGFYSWYAAYHSLKSLNINFYSFEKKALILPFTIYMIVLFVLYIIQNHNY